MFSSSKSFTGHDNKGYGSTNNISNGISNGATKENENGLIQKMKISNGNSFIGESYSKCI